jgi:nucleoside-diphosphate-sugar epimerase
MRILILGAAGMLGRKVATRLAQDGALAGKRITHLLLADAAEEASHLSADFEVEAVVAELTKTAVSAQLVASRPDVIFQLAAVVSGEAEADFDRGYRVNIDAMRSLLEAVRELGSVYRPRLVFSSSIAVFGPPFPEVIGDEHATTPATSYGTQKAIVELLLTDYTRLGFLDGVGIRLPTICVRPGIPNRAASSFFSSIIREPLNGEEAVLPVPDSVRHWFASPRAAVDFLVHAAELDTAAIGGRRCLTMPGVSATVADQIEALRKVGGEAAVRRIRREPDEMITRIVQTWPGNFETQRAHELGFRAETNFAEIVRVHVEDELGSAMA